MIKGKDKPKAEQARRLRLKTQEQQLAKMAVDGAGLSPWEAAELVKMVAEVYFAEPQDNPIRSGQMFYECAATSEGAGKPLSECDLARVVLTIHDPEDIQIHNAEGADGLRRHCILRMTEEAREQDGLMTQEDLARLLHCDVRTIRRDVKHFRERGIVVATRGTMKDIGPGVSHRGVAIGHWVNGDDTPEIARKINHSLAAVERYIDTFARVVFLEQQRFDCFAMALTMRISVAGAKTFLAILEEHRHRPEFKRRLQELEIIGGRFFEAEDFEKGGPTPSANAKNAWRLP